MSSGISIRIVLLGLIAFMDLMMVVLGAQPLVDAVRGYGASRQLVRVIELNHAFFETLQNLRLENGAETASLLANGPIAADLLKVVEEHRAAGENFYSRLIAMASGMDIASLPDVLARLQLTHQRLAELRPIADAQVKRQQPDRDPSVVKAWPETTAAVMAVLSAGTDVMDNAIRMHDPLVDALVLVKREGWVAREFAGYESRIASAALATGQPWSIAQIRSSADSRGHVAAAWDVVRAIVRRPDMSQQLKTAQERADNGWFRHDREVRAPIYEALAAGRVPPVALTDWMGASLQDLGTINEVMIAALADMTAVAKLDLRIASRVMIAAGLLLLTALSVTIGAVGIVHFRISRPMRALTEVMGRLTQQDYTAQIPSLYRKDELGAIAMAVRSFRENGLTVQRLEADTLAQRQGAEAAAERAQALQTVRAAEREVVVEALAGALARIAEGDLTCRIETNFAAEYERLRADFNAAVAGLQGAITAIDSHVTTIRSGTQDVAAATDDLAQRTEQEAARLQRAASALQQITAAVGRTAAGSDEAYRFASQTQNDAERSGQVVREAVASMGAIEVSAGEIAQINVVIDEIAFQTNLLALNAGVEAARAGDSGRGFAVVASEVRALAQRSAAAAHDIAGLINTSTDQVSRGVALVGQTGDALERICVHVAKINRGLGEIAASAREQATGLAEVDAAFGEMDQVTQQNAAMVEQTTAASHALSHETDDLARSAARFRVGGDVEHIRQRAIIGAA